MNYGGNNHL